MALCMFIFAWFERTLIINNAGLVFRVQMLWYRFV